MFKRILSAVLIAVMAATLLTGCVTVVKKGEEGALTGEVEFNPGDSVEAIWDSGVLPECEMQAVEISEMLTTASGNLTGVGEELNGYKTQSATYYNYKVKVTGAEVVAVDKDSYYKTMQIAIPDYDGDATVTVQLGAYKGTSVRDAMTFIDFADFTNQTEWGQVNKSMIDKIDETVVAPVLDSIEVGSTIDLTGCFTADNANTMVITPVVLTVQ